MGKDYVIMQVSWLTQLQGSVHTREEIVQMFFILAQFLQKNGLVKRQLAKDEGDITDDFAIRTDDLTEEGDALLRKAESKGGWLDKVDHGMDPADVRSLERALKRIRGK